MKLIIDKAYILKLAVKITISKNWIAPGLTSVYTSKVISKQISGFLGGYLSK